MSKKVTEVLLLRMFFEITQLNNSQGMTLKELSQKWVDSEHSDEVPISWDMFNRDRMTIGSMFGISIAKRFDKAGDIFYIANPHVLENNENLKFAWNAGRMIELRELYALEGTRLDISHFVDAVEKVMFFGESVKKNKTVKINHQKFDCSDITEVNLEPYWLKEYEGRLYLVGHIVTCKNRRKVYAYGLDRIWAYEIVPTKRRFKVPVGMDPISYYANVCGLVVPENQNPQKIRIRAYDDEPCYLLTKPIHHSQKLVSNWQKGDPYADFELFLIPTKEFTKKIIERAGRIVVLSPENVRKDFLETIEFIASRFRGA